MSVKLLEIAEKLGKSRQTITLWCEKLEIETSSQGGPRRAPVTVSDKDAKKLIGHVPVMVKRDKMSKFKSTILLNHSRGLYTRLCEDYLPVRFY